MPYPRRYEPGKECLNDALPAARGGSTNVRAYPQEPWIIGTPTADRYISGRSTGRLGASSAETSPRRCQHSSEVNVLSSLNQGRGYSKQR